VLTDDKKTSIEHYVNELNEVSWEYHLLHVIMQCSESLKFKHIEKSTSSEFNKAKSDFSDLKAKKNATAAEFDALEKRTKNQNEKEKKIPVSIILRYSSNIYDDDNKVRTCIFENEKGCFYEIVLPQSLKTDYDNTKNNRRAQLTVIREIRKLIAKQLGFIVLYKDKISPAPRGTLNLENNNEITANVKIFAEELLRAQFQRIKDVRNDYF